MALYHLTAVSPEQFAEILNDEPKQFGKPTLSGFPSIWCPELWMEKAERWFWPYSVVEPTVEVEAIEDSFGETPRAYIEA